MAQYRLNQDKFYSVYSENGQILHVCPACRSMINVIYKPNYGVRLYCPNGCHILTLYRKKLWREAPTEKAFVRLAVDKWNAGEVD